MLFTLFSRFGFHTPTKISSLILCTHFQRVARLILWYIYYIVKELKDIRHRSSTDQVYRLDTRRLIWIGLKSRPGTARCSASHPLIWKDRSWQVWLMFFCFMQETTSMDSEPCCCSESSWRMTDSQVMLRAGLKGINSVIWSEIEWNSRKFVGRWPLRGLQQHHCFFWRHAPLQVLSTRAS